MKRFVASPPSNSSGCAAESVSIGDRRWHQRKPNKEAWSQTSSKTSRAKSSKQPKRCRTLTVKYDGSFSEVHPC